jgi:hypothetical protein
MQRKLERQGTNLTAAGSYGFAEQTRAFQGAIEDEQGTYDTSTSDATETDSTDADAGDDTATGEADSTDAKADQATDPADKDADKDTGKAADKTSPTDSEAKLLKETMKWKDRFKDTERQLKEIRNSLGDVDPATARQLATDAKERERSDLEKKGEYDRIVAQMRDENAKLVEDKDTELSDVKAQLNDAIGQVENLTVGAEFRSSDFVAKQSTLPPTIAQKEFGNHFEFEYGQLVPYDKPKGAKDRTRMVDANGTPKTFDQAIAELYSKHPDAKSLIRTTMKAGAGSKNQTDVADKSAKTPDVRGLSRIEAGLKDRDKANQ